MSSTHAKLIGGLVIVVIILFGALVYEEHQREVLLQTANNCAIGALGWPAGEKGYDACMKANGYDPYYI